MGQFNGHFSHGGQAFDSFVLLLKSFHFGYVPDYMKSADRVAAGIGKRRA